MTKLWTVNDTMGIAAVANNAGYVSHLVESFRGLTKTPKTFDELAEDFLIHARKDWREATQGIPPQKYAIEFILTGYQKDIPKIKCIAWNDEQSAIVMGDVVGPAYPTGLWTIAQYWINTIEGLLPSMSVQDLKCIAAFLIEESSLFNAIGGPIQMIVIQKNKDIETITREKSNQLKAIATKAIKETTDFLISQLGNK